jgi:predicted amino acid dehydrogenase
MLMGDLDPIHQMVVDAVELAIDEGYHVIGFGGFTSIVTKNCTTIISDTVSLTSGNALTVGLGLEAMYRASIENNIDLNKSCLASIGANGNICSIYSEIMAENVPKIILIGREGKEERLKSVAEDIYHNAFNDILLYELHIKGEDDDVVNKVTNLAGIAKEIYETKTIKYLLNNYRELDNIKQWLYESLTGELKEDSPIKLTSDYSSLKEANLIIAASNSPTSIVFPDMLGDMPIIINDIAVPNDVDSTVKKEKKNVHVINGGLAKLPLNQDFKLRGMPLSDGHCFACQAEAIVLGMLGSREHYSYGRISKRQVKNIMEMAKFHGIRLGEYKTERSY